MDHAAVRVPAGPRPAAPGIRGAGGARRGGTGGAAVRLVPGTAGHRLPARPAADRSGGGHPEGRAALEHSQRAWHLAQPVLCRPGAVQPHSGGAGPRPQVGDAPGRAGRQPCAAAGGGLDCGPGTGDRLRGNLCPGAGEAGRQPAGRGPQHPPRVPAARADQLRRLPAGMHRPPDRSRLPLLPVPRPHRPAACRTGTALHRPLHPRRAAGRAGLGRPVRAADRPRPGHPRAGPGTRRRLAAPGTPGPAGHHRPGSGPARPPAAAAAGRLPRRGDHPAGTGTQAPGPGSRPRHAARPAAPAGCRGPAAAGTRRRRRRDRGILPDGPGWTGHRHVRAAAAAGRAAHRPRGGHRRRGRDPLRAPDLARRAAPPFLSVA